MPAAPPASPPRFGVAVEAGHRVGQVFHGIAVEAALLGQLIEQGILVEALHLDDPVDRIPGVAAQRKAAAASAHHRHDPVVDVGRGPPVHLELGLAKLPPQRR